MASTNPPLTSNIQRVIVLMFENRSFDNMLGGLYPGQPGFLTGTETNPLNPLSTSSELIQVWQGASSQDFWTMPFPDPGELFSEMNQQIFGSYSTTNPNMQGFVWSYASLSPYPADIMHYYHPCSADYVGNVPITSLLARNFAVCPQWMASGPVQTFANRVFTHCATPGSYTTGGETRAFLNDLDYVHALEGVADTCIFELLDKAFGSGQQNWAVYSHDYSLSQILVKYVGENSSNVLPFRQFADDVNNLPVYTFIEPQYSELGGIPNSNHPGSHYPISICYGEQLLADIYTTLYNSDIFDSTLLIVTYDEHGGLYDHVPPPAAVSPFPPNTITGFDYNRYGVRVPTFFVNPYIPPGTVLWSPTETPFDHTSIISTLIQQFGLSPSSLTPRDQSAPALTGLIGSSRQPNPLSPSDLPTLNCPPPAAAPAGGPGMRPDLLKKITALQAARSKPR